MKYDTSAIRRVARKVGNVSGDVSDQANNLTRMLSSVPNHFQGEAADVFIDTLEQLKSDLRNMSSGLSAIKSELNAFAAKLDEIDRRAAQAIKQK